MKKMCNLGLILLVGLSALTACHKGDGLDVLKKSCLYSSRSDFFKKWANAYTEIDTYSTTGTIIGRQFIYPYGYFKLNTDLSYNVLSDGVPLNGVWDVNANCQLVLDSNNTTLHRDFDVLKINNDSLVLRRKAGNLVYTQHYVAFMTCPTALQMEQQWDNVFTRYDYFTADGNAIYSAVYVRPVGYFKINTDASYTVLSDGDLRSGTWLYDQPGCKLTLDKNTVNERTFDVMQFTSDSLTIWRKDAVQNEGFTQHYKKH